jgi:DNA-binding CsgD family transcriptional regulator
MAFRVKKIDSKASLNRKLSAACFLMGLYEFFMSLMLVAPSVVWFNAFMVSASTVYLVLGPVTCMVILDFGGIRKGWTDKVLVAASAVMALLQIVQVWGGHWVVIGYHPSMWGNVIHISQDPKTGAINQISNAINSLVGVLSLVYAWAHSRSRRYRTLVIAFVLLAFLLNMWSFVSTRVILMDRGLPDPSCLGGAVVLILYTLLIERYQHLTERKPDMTGPLLAILPGTAVFADVGGKVVKAPDEAAKFLGSKLENRFVWTILTGWPGLSGTWSEMQKDLKPRTDMAGTVGVGKYRLHLYPHFNPFDIFDGVLVYIAPEGKLDETLTTCGFSVREQEVARLVCEGFDTRQIGETLCISPATVKKHLHKIYQKTGTAGRSDLVRSLLGKS